MPPTPPNKPFLTPNTIPSESISFLKALIGTCTGVSIFPYLIGQRLWRTLLHVVILLLISGVILAVLQIPEIKNDTLKIGNFMDANYGTIHFSNTGIVPEKPISESIAHMPLTPILWLDYFACPDSFVVDSLREVRMKNYPMGIQWSPKLILFWQKVGESFSVYPVVAPLNYPNTITTEPSLEKVRQRASQFVSTDSVVYAFYPVPGVNFCIPLSQLMQPSSNDESVGSFNCSDLLNSALYTPALVPVFAIYTALSTLILVLFISALFSLSSFLFSDMESKRILTFARMWTLTLYAAFPSVIVATLWESVGLRVWGLDYAQIILYALLFYSFVAQFKVQRSIVRKPAPIDP